MSNEIKAKISERAMELLEEVVSSWHLSYAEGGPMVQELERQFERVQGQPGVAVVNCTVGLEMVIRALGLQMARVVVPANGMAADVLAVLNAGAVPVFVDVDWEYGCLTPSIVREVLSHLICEAMLLVHIGMVNPWAEEIARICEDKRVALIEDCAHVMGDPQSGTFGVAAVYSMYATKVLPAGEGGVVSGKPALLKRIRHMRMHGRISEWSSTFDECGTNAKMSELNAAFGVAVLEHAEGIIERRLTVCALYERELGQGWFGGVGYKYVILPHSLEKLLPLESQDVFSGPIFRTPLPFHPAFENYEKFGDLEGTKDFCSRHVCLKTDVSIEEAEGIALAVKRSMVD